MDRLNPQASRMGPLMKSVSAFKLLSILALASVFPSSSFAQQGGFGVGVALVSLFPSGDFENHAGVGYGGMGGVELGGENIHLTARSGYLKHLERRDQEIRFIPMFGGLKASTGDGGIFFFGEMGPVLTKYNYKGPLLTASDENENNLGWGVGVGSGAGPLDIRFNFNAWDARHLSRSMTIGLSLGFTARSY